MTKLASRRRTGFSKCVGYILIDLLLKSHDTPAPYLTMHHVVTEMCTCVLISIKNGALWDMCLMNCGICEMGLSLQAHAVCQQAVTHIRICAITFACKHNQLQWGAVTRNAVQYKMIIRADPRFAPSQWETALLCNDVSHWLDANLESAMIIDTSLQRLRQNINQTLNQKRHPIPWPNWRAMGYLLWDFLTKLTAL